MGAVIQSQPNVTMLKQPAGTRPECADLFEQYRELRTQGFERQAPKSSRSPRTTLHNPRCYVIDASRHPTSMCYLL